MSIFHTSKALSRSSVCTGTTRIAASFSTVRAHSITPRSTSIVRLPNIKRQFSLCSHHKMPENLKQGEVNAQTDPSVAKQYDNETSKVKQVEDFYRLVDGKKVSMLNTYRNSVGPVGRSMSVAKRSGPDFLYIANAHSKKMDDLKQNKEIQISFQDTKTQDWISVSGVVTTLSNSDPRIKELYSSGIKAWFGDLGDGKHDGGPEDPRMTLIEVKAKYVVYYQTEVGSLGMMKEVGVAAVTGKVAKTGTLRELTEQDLEQARKMG